MIFDLRTIYAMTAVACVVLGFIQGIAFLSGRFERWLAWWSASNIVVGAATFIIALRDFAPDFLTIQVGNTLTVVGCLLLPAAMHAFANRQVRLVPLLLLIVLLSMPCLMTFTGHDGSLQRIAYGSALCTILDLMVAWQAFLLFREEKLQSARLTAGLFSLTAAIYGTRTLLSASGLLATQDLFQGGDAAHSWIGLSSMMFLALRSTAIMLMATERTSNQLREAAFHDPLTGALNRSGLLQHLPPATCRPLSVLLVDLDHFKQLNDTAGHAAGDRVLKVFAATVREVIGRDDLFARHGGDEFVIVLCRQQVEQARITAERIRQQFALSLAVMPEALSVRPTLSIGIAAHASGPVDLNAVLQKADHALYHRKRLGRDGIEAYAEDRSAA